MVDINSLLDIMARLRDPESGCPWDLQQDWRSLTRYTLEEVYEVIDAIERDDAAQLRDELGDLLFQIVFYSQVATEQACFSMQDVVDAIAAKLVNRHPHVFVDQGATLDVGSIKMRWEQRKAQERLEKGVRGLLGDIPLALPALQRAGKIQSRLASVGFDWTASHEVLRQLREEIDELEMAMKSGDPAASSEELGDVLFSCVNLARHLQLDPESCLRDTNTKVMSRVDWMEQALSAEGHSVQGQPMERLESLWKQAKQSLRQDPA